MDHYSHIEQVAHFNSPNSKFLMPFLGQAIGRCPYRFRPKLGTGLGRKKMRCYKVFRCYRVITYNNIFKYAFKIATQIWIIRAYNHLSSCYYSNMEILTWNSCKNKSTYELTLFLISADCNYLWEIHNMLLFIRWFNSFSDKVWVVPEFLHDHRWLRVLFIHIFLPISSAHLKLLVW